MGLTLSYYSSLSFFGIGEEDDMVTLTTNYQSFNKDTQVYLQFDMGNYEKGNYIVRIIIEDNLSDKSVSEETLIRWR